MGNLVKKVKQSFSKLLAVIGMIFVILAFCYWNKELSIDGSMFGFGEYAGGITLGHWELLALGVGMVFMAYVFDAESAAEIIGYAGDIVSDATEAVVDVASTAASGIFGILWDNLLPIGLAVGGIYVAGKVIDSDNSEPSGNITLDLGNSGYREEFPAEGRDGKESGAGSPIQGSRVQSNGQEDRRDGS